MEGKDGCNLMANNTACSTQYSIEKPGVLIKSTNNPIQV